ncbi:hypothetical protein D7V86_04905 [bacterium D16-51]|nr:hypothetical protein D7V96_05880 [bacterium D16-59]RKI61619.1 hypothetical protein D7V86_04905 [bacterium D16-51]
MSVEKGFTKENLDYYLKELAKEFRKRNGKNMPAEIVLVGGAAILANYGFREMTYDIDAVITASSAMKEAVNTVGDRFGLPNGWLNADFKNTSSYSPKLSQYSKYYRTYSNVLNIRTISAEYLVAMKLMSGRRYKKDLSDIIGILSEQERMGEPLNYQQIDCAVRNLYGGWDNISGYAIQVLKAALDSENLKELFIEQEHEEALSKQTVLQVQKYEGKKVKESNVDEIIQKALRKKRDSRDVR